MQSGDAGHQEKDDIMKTKKVVIGALFAALTGIALASVGGGSASAEQPRPGSVDPRVRQQPPTFSCGVSFGANNQPMVTVTQTGGVVDKAHDVVAIITTPSGKKSAAICGSAFSGVGTHASVSWSNPATNDKSYIYLCSASEGATTFACNPVR